MRKKGALRFAPIIRVSTEIQEKKGESLAIQKKMIEQDVKHMGGVIPKHCWSYTGQERATPNEERKKFQQMLSDSDKNLFDAVIVYDIFRWSRDSETSKKGLSLLRKNGISFFVRTMEYNLFNPDHLYMLGINVESGEHQAGSMAKRSIEGRIKKAKRGYWTAGSLPTGRTFDKKTGKWGIKAEVKKKIERAAKMYLEGHSLQKI